MRSLRLKVLSACLLVFGLPAFATAQSGIVVKITPNQLPASPHQKAVVEIEVDAPHTVSFVGGVGASSGFKVGLGGSSGSGKLTPKDPGDPRWSGSDYFYLKGEQIEGKLRNRGRIIMNYDTGDNPKPGEVIVTVSPGVIGMAGGVNARGQGMLVLSQTKVEVTPAGPTRKPPFRATSSGVNTSKKAVEAAATLAAILAVAAGVTYAARTRRRQPKPKPKPAEPTVAEAPPPAQSERPPRPGSFEVELNSLSELEGNGDPAALFALQAVPIVSEGFTAEILQVTFRSDKASSFPRGIHQSDRQSLDATVNVPWAWADMTVTFTVEVAARLIDTRSPQAKPVAVPPAHASCSILVRGAYPRFVTEALTRSVRATGRDRAKVATSLWLFGRPAPEESIDVTGLEGRILGPESGKGPIWESRGTVDGTAPLVLAIPGQIVCSWAPPFLIQAEQTFQGGGLDEATIEVSAWWVGGPQLMRALACGAGTPPVRHGGSSCQVQLYSCGVEEWAVSPEVLFPGKATEIRARARLFCDAPSAGPVDNPFADQAVHAPRAGITCKVYDRSQAPPHRTKEGCTVPPQAVASDRTPAVSPPPIKVDWNGLLYTPVGDPDRGPVGPRPIFIHRYHHQQGCDPIDGAPVEIEMAVEDGLGGRVVLRGASRIALGILVLETGGPDFRYYENRPSLLDVRYQSPTGLPSENGATDADLGLDRPVRLNWEFAVVDEWGKPLAWAGAAVTEALRVGWADPGFHLMMGYAHPEFEMAIDPASGDVKCVRGKDARAGGRSELPASWHWVSPDDRSWANQLRGHWHRHREKLGRADKGLPGLWQGPGTEWRKMALTLAVRVEMRDRASGELLATSDRVLDGCRTPPGYVWADHRFAWVFRLPILFLPGFEGSQLEAGSTCLWPPASFGGATPDEARRLEMLELKEQNRANVRPVGLVYRSTEGEVYRGLIKGLMAELGYWEANASLLPEEERVGDQPLGTGEHLGLSLMPYDWRRDNREHEPELARRIEELVQSYYPNELLEGYRKASAALPLQEAQRGGDLQQHVLLLTHGMGGLIAWHFGRGSGQALWERHIASCVMLAAPVMGAAEPAYRLLTGKAPGFSQQAKTTGLLAESVRKVLGGYPSMYQLCAPYHPCFQVEIEGEDAPLLVSPGQIRELVGKGLIAVSLREIEGGRRVVGLIAPFAPRTARGPMAPNSKWTIADQPVLLDDMDQFEMWPRMDLQEAGLRFHAEKGLQPPPGCLLMYGIGQETIDSVALTVTTKNGREIGHVSGPAESEGSVLTIEVRDPLVSRTGDGVVPAWSAAAQDPDHGIDIPKDLALYEIPLSESGKGTDIGGRPITHHSLGSHGRVQEMLRSILTGTMPEPDFHLPAEEAVPRQKRPWWKADRYTRKPDSSGWETFASIGKKIVSIGTGVLVGGGIVALGGLSLPVLAAGGAGGLFFGILANQFLNLGDARLGLGDILSSLKKAVVDFASLALPGVLLFATAAGILWSAGVSGAALLAAIGSTLAALGIVGVAAFLYSMAQGHWGWELFPWEKGSKAYSEKTAEEKKQTFADNVAALLLAVILEGLLKLRGKGKGGSEAPKTEPPAKSPTKPPAQPPTQPLPGLESEGYRPTPGERSTSREQWRDQQQQQRTQHRKLTPSEVEKSEREVAEAIARYDALGDQPPKLNIMEHDQVYQPRAHTIKRHGPDVPLSRNDAPAGIATIEGRIHGDAGWNKQATWSYRWIDEATMNRIVNEHLRSNWDRIRSELVLNNHYEATFDTRKMIGEGFYNAGQHGIGPRRAVYHTTSNVTITLELIPGSSPPKFMVIRAFPAGSGLSLD